MGQLSHMIIEDAPAVGYPDDALNAAFLQAGVTVSMLPFYRHRDTVMPPTDQDVRFTGIMGTLAAIRSWCREGIRGCDTLLPLFSPQFQRVHRYHGQLPPEGMLNRQAVMLPYGQLRNMTIRELASRLNVPPALGLIIKPDQAMKVAEAALTGLADINTPVSQWFDRSGLSPDSLMWFGPRAHLVSEYRCLIIDGECTSASRYGFQQDSENADANYTLLRQASTWARAMTFDDPAYMMDIAELRDGSLAIIELNALSTSGLYALNREAVVQAWQRSAQLIWARDYA